MIAAALPILIELFTSEGCSSCPPADAVLARLHETQPAPGVQLVVLSEHVDYWNDLGWRDPFSDHLFSERQSRYGQRIYTPQAIVDGRVDVLGSDADGLIRAAEGAAADPHGTVRLNCVHKPPDASAEKNNFFSSCHVVVDQLPAHGPAQVLLAIVEDGLVSKVLKGENAGRTLQHTAVVRSLTGVGSIAVSAMHWEGDFEVPPHRRAVAFVQDRESLRVLASGSM